MVGGQERDGLSFPGNPGLPVPWCDALSSYVKLWLQNLRMWLDLDIGSIKMSSRQHGVTEVALIQSDLCPYKEEGTRHRHRGGTPHEPADGAYKPRRAAQGKPPAPGPRAPDLRDCGRVKRPPELSHAGASVRPPPPHLSGQ